MELGRANVRLNGQGVPLSFHSHRFAGLQHLVENGVDVFPQPRGAVGVIRTTAAAGERFLVRFPDGFEAAFDRAQLDVLKHFKDRVGPEQSKLEHADVTFHEKGYERLRNELQCAYQASSLPEIPDDRTRVALNDLLSNNCLLFARRNG